MRSFLSGGAGAGGAAVGPGHAGAAPRLAAPAPCRGRRTRACVGLQSRSKDKRSPTSPGFGRSCDECGERLLSAAKIIKAQLFMVAVIILSALPSCQTWVPPSDDVQHSAHTQPQR